MNRTLVVLALALAVPLAGATGLIPLNPILNGNFDVDTATQAAAPAAPLVDVCVGIGHQALIPLYSPYGDWAIAVANDASADPTVVPGIVTDPAFPDDATGYPVQYASDAAAAPDTVVLCDPGYQDLAQINPARKIMSGGASWSSDPGTTYRDFSGDGDIEAIIPVQPEEHSHNLWQSTATTTIAWSADFDAFRFVLESGTIPPPANIQLGLALTPSYQQSPWLAGFWEGAVLFRSNDLVPSGDGTVSVHPIDQGEIICPAGYTPCLAFKADYDAADVAGKHTLLGQVRIVQTSFWSFHNAGGPVVLDNVAIVGGKTMAETVPNAGNI